MQASDMKLLEELVITVAKEILLPRFARVGIHRKADGSIVTEADTLVQQRLQAALAGKWPRVAFLGEEMEAAEQARRLKGREELWILDPLDGTSNFVAGIPHFSVSLALAINGQLTAGFVYDPIHEEMFTAARGKGAFLNGLRLSPLPVPRLRNSIGLVDFKRLPARLAQRLASAPPYSSQRSFGSAALDWCNVAAGRCHVYLHGRQKLWDLAAGSLILEEAGGLSTTLEGKAVSRVGLEPRSVVAALDPGLFSQWTDWLGVRRR